MTAPMSHKVTIWLPKEYKRAAWLGSPQLLVDSQHSNISQWSSEQWVKQWAVSEQWVKQWAVKHTLVLLYGAPQLKKSKQFFLQNIFLQILFVLGSELEKLMDFEYIEKNYPPELEKSWFQRKNEKYKIFPTRTFTFNFGRNWFTCTQKLCICQFF